MAQPVRPLINKREHGMRGWLVLYIKAQVWRHVILDVRLPVRRGMRAVFTTRGGYLWRLWRHRAGC